MNSKVITAADQMLQTEQRHAHVRRGDDAARCHDPRPHPSFSVPSGAGGAGSPILPRHRRGVSSSITVTKRIMRIGDLIDDAGAVAEVADLSRRPISARGRDRSHRRGDLVRRLVDIDARGLTEVVRHAASRAITAQGIRRRGRALSGRSASASAQRHRLRPRHPRSADQATRCRRVPGARPPPMTRARHAST